LVLFLLIFVSHGGNWLFKGDTALAIDHGHSHWSWDANDRLDNSGISPFASKVRSWVNGVGPNLFSVSEMESMLDRIKELEPMYRAAGANKLNYYEKAVLPRMKKLVEAARARA
jgi:hypothetical protein